MLLARGALLRSRPQLKLPNPRAARAPVATQDGRRGPLTSICQSSASGRHPLQQQLASYFQKIPRPIQEQVTALDRDSPPEPLAIRTVPGKVKFFGSPGVEVIYQQAENIPVKHLFFLHGHGRSVVIYENGLLELLELRNVAGVSELQLVKEASFSSLVDVGCASMANNKLYVGTSKGMLFSVQLPSLELQDESKVLEARQPTQLTEAQSPSVVNHAAATGMETAAVQGETRAKSEYAQLYGEKSSAVLALAPHPLKADVLAVGMAGGRIFVCDLTATLLLNTFYHDQEVTGLAWSSAGTSLYAAFHDGGYLCWDTADNALKGKPVIPYGPFPCLPMRRMTVYSDNELIAPWIVFEGGLPPRFHQHNSLTILCNDKHDVFDFPAPIVDYFLLDRTEGAISRPHTLMVLLNNQLVAIDLTADKFPEISAPYLFSMHAPITAFQYLSDVAPAVLKDLADVTSKPSELRPFGGFLHTVSQRQWPVLGGRMVQDTESKSGLLLTAHGDGSVRFWEVSSGKVRFLHRVAAPTRYYYIDQDNVDYTDDNFDVWPPFRKYGVSAGEICDQRLRIEQLFFDPTSRMLAVAGQAGRVMLYTFSDNYAVVDFQTIGVPLVGEDFVWRGCQPLPHRSGNLEEFAGFQGQLNIQLYPPSQITSLHMHPQWKLLAVGTAYGVALIQYANRACVWSQCTLDRREEGALLQPAAGGGSLSFQQKARLAGDTLRRSLRRIPRPHIPLRTPSSPLVENGKTGKYRPVEGEPEPASPDAVIALRIEEERVAAPSPGEIKPPTPIIPTEDILKETGRNSMMQAVNGETAEVVRKRTEVVNRKDPDVCRLMKSAPCTISRPLALRPFGGILYPGFQREQPVQSSSVYSGFSRNSVRSFSLSMPLQKKSKDKSSDGKSSYEPRVILSPREIQYRPPTISRFDPDAVLQRMRCKGCTLPNCLCLEEQGQRRGLSDAVRRLLDFKPGYEAHAYGIVGRFLNYHVDPRFQASPQWMFKHEDRKMMPDYICTIPRNNDYAHGLVVEVKKHPDPLNPQDVEDLRKQCINSLYDYCLFSLRNDYSHFPDIQYGAGFVAEYACIASVCRQDDGIFTFELDWTDLIDHELTVGLKLRELLHNK